MEERTLAVEAERLLALTSQRGVREAKTRLEKSGEPLLCRAAALVNCTAATAVAPATRKPYLVAAAAAAQLGLQTSPLCAQLHVTLCRSLALRAESLVEGMSADGGRLPPLSLAQREAWAALRDAADTALGLPLEAPRMLLESERAALGAAAAAAERADPCPSTAPPSQIQVLQALRQELEEWRGWASRLAAEGVGEEGAVTLEEWEARSHRRGCPPASLSRLPLSGSHRNTTVRLAVDA